MACDGYLIPGVEERLNLLAEQLEVHMDTFGLCKTSCRRIKGCISILSSEIDFAMNTVCTAGIASFLYQQAARLNIPIHDFGKLALQSKIPVRIAGHLQFLLNRT